MTRSPCPMPRPLSPLRPSFSPRAPTFLVTHIGTSRHTPRHLPQRARALLAPHVPAVCLPRAARSPAGAKPTAVGKARICVSKTGEYSIKRRKLLYFFAFFKVLFKKSPLNSRGEKILRSFLPSCRSGAICGFRAEKGLFCGLSDRPFSEGRERVFRALLLLRCFFCSFFSCQPRSSPNRLALAKAKPRMPRGFAPFFYSFADGLAPSPTADAFLPATV